MLCRPMLTRAIVTDFLVMVFTVLVRKAPFIDVVSFQLKSAFGTFHMVKLRSCTIEYLAAFFQFARKSNNKKHNYSFST